MAASIRLTGIVELGYLITQYAGTSWWLHQNNIPHQIHLNPCHDVWFPWCDESQFEFNHPDSIIKTLINGKLWKQKPFTLNNHWSHKISYYEADFDPYEVYKTWSPPPYQKIFKEKNSLELPEKPVLLITNQFNLESGANHKPQNYYPIAFLDGIIKLLGDKYEIWYSRPTGNEIGYSDDGIVGASFADFDLIKKFKNRGIAIRTVTDFMEETKLGYNEVLLRMLALSDKILCVAGGNACLASYFGKECIIYINPESYFYKRGAPKRHLWYNGTWLDKLNDENSVFGYDSLDEIHNVCRERWL